MAFNNEYKQYFNLKVSTLNFHGLKSNIGYTKNSFNENHVNFICEHWLQPHELSIIQAMLKDDNKWCHLQSNVDSLQNNRGN